MGSWSVHLTTDKGQIEAFLRRDPVYAAYAIGDLEPEHAPFCTWRLAEVDGQIQALALEYRRIDPPVLLTIGEAEGIEAIFDTAALPDRCTMVAQAEHLPVFQAHYDFSGDQIYHMVRMKLAPEAFRPAASQPATRDTAHA